MSDTTRERLFDLKKRRGGFKSAVTRIINDIETLASSRDGKFDPCREQFNAKLDTLNRVMCDVQNIHDKIVADTKDTTDLQEAEEYMQAIHCDVERTQRLVTELLWDVKPNDSISHVASNTSSRLSSERTRIAATAAILAVTAKRQKEMQALEREELALKHKRDALQLDIQLNSTTAEMEVFDQSLENAAAATDQVKTMTDSVNVLNVSDAHVEQNANDTFSCSNVPPGVGGDVESVSHTQSRNFATASATSSHGYYMPQNQVTMSPVVESACKPQFTQYCKPDMSVPLSQVPQTVNVSANVPPGYVPAYVPPTPVNPVKSVPSQFHVTNVQNPQVYSSADTNMYNPHVQSIVNANNVPLMTVPQPDPYVSAWQQQQQIVNLLHLPKLDLVTFDGDPLKYWVFCRQFDNVNRNSNDASMKLALLIQYCTGKARQVIESCSAMEPNLGYMRARELLHNRFGNELLIAERWTQKLTDGPAITAKDKTGIQGFADDLQNCIGNLCAVNQLGEMNAQSVLKKLVCRLPTFARTRWMKEVQKIRKYSQKNPDVTDLLKLIQDIAAENNDPVYGDLLSSSVKDSSPRTYNKPNSRKLSHSAFGVDVSNSANKETSTVCSLCEQKHSLFQCDVFKGMPVSDRRDYVMKKKLCFNCLKYGHNAQNCRLNRVCSVQGCSKKHTKFLHVVSSANEKEKVESKPREKTTFEEKSTVEEKSTTKNSSTTCGATGAGICKKIALPILPVKVRAVNSDHHVIVHALLDSGSTGTFTARKLADSIGAHGVEQSINLTTLDKEDTEIKTTAVNLEIAPLEENSFYPLNNVYTRNSIPIRSCNTIKQQDLAKWSHLKDIHVPVSSDEVLLLIGQDHPDLILPREIRSGEPGTPYATRSLLGWTINGPLEITTTKQKQKMTSEFTGMIGIEETLDKQVERFWKVDDYESTTTDKTSMSQEDLQTIQIWNDSITKSDNNHYTLDMPLRHSPPGLDDNRKLAEKRLQYLGNRLRQDSDLHEMYTKGIQSLLDKGYAEEIEPASEEDMTWYLPHHPVFHPHKPGKVRIVFDCAAKFNGSSLNDKVMQGPDLTNTLLGVLLRFRQEKIVVKADIEAMFHQVHVNPEQRDLLRFLWWPDGNLSLTPKTYRMTVHLFGGNWSPSCCNFALRHTASENEQDFPSSVTDSVTRNFYVDDLLTSVPCVSDAVELAHGLKDLLHRGGFNLTKWMSNSRDVLSTIPQEDQAAEIKDLDLNMQALPTDRALGLIWNAEEDAFRFNIKQQDKPLTRRGLLSAVSTIYDPVGFLAPFTVTAKKLIQDLTRKQIGWDETLPKEDLEQWMQWKSDISKICEISIPRCYKLSVNEDQEVSYDLHHFSDASLTAYGVASYLRVETSDGSSTCHLILAKSRLCPLKTMTIPRLELAAAALAVQVNKMLQRELDLKIRSTTYWTDSNIVLSYIHNTKSRFQTYVANRIATIHSGSNIHQWRHIESAENPADDVSRGLSAETLVQSQRWLSGPSFLSKPECDWPDATSIKVIDEHDPEVKIEKPTKQLRTMATSTEDVTPTDKLINQFSSWYKLKRIVARLLQIKNLLLTKVRKLPQAANNRHLTNEDISTAEDAIISYTQRSAFGDKLSPNNGKTWKNTDLYKLSPTVINGKLCVGGRLSNADLPESQIHPILLPKRHHVIDLIVRDCHEANGHVGREHVLSLVRQKYWIISGRQAVRRILNDCFKCKRDKAKPSTQKMADLPASRVQADLPPFSFTGVDIFGPFLIRRGRSEIKHYGCIFTCLVMRAIHIEVTHSLETNSFVNALQRFISRRGTPREIWCDNGTNFIGAEKQLKQSLEEWNHAQISSHLLQKGITWHFNPPKGSHMGGAWERMIRSVRSILTTLLDKQKMDAEILMTSLCTVESIINSRPLTPVTDDPTDLKALSPNDLLLPGASHQLPLGIFQKEDQYVKRRWRQVEYIADVFWRRFTREYLPILQARTKWQDEQRDIDVGDIVLVVEETSRNLWPLARVMEVYPGQDGHVRSAKIKTKTSTLIRPIVKLCLLEAQS